MSFSGFSLYHVKRGAESLKECEKRLICDLDSLKGAGAAEALIENLRLELKEDHRPPMGPTIHALYWAIGDSLAAASPVVLRALFSSTNTSCPPQTKPKSKGGKKLGAPKRIPSNMVDGDRLRREWENELKEVRAGILDLLRKWRGAKMRGDHKKAARYFGELRPLYVADAADFDELVRAEVKCVPKKLRGWAWGPAIWAFVNYRDQCAAESELEKWAMIEQLAIFELLSHGYERSRFMLRQLHGRERGAEVKRWADAIFDAGGKDAAFLHEKLAIAEREWLKESNRNQLSPRELEALLRYRRDLNFSKIPGRERHTREEIKAIVAPNNRMTMHAFSSNWLSKFNVQYVQLKRGVGSRKHEDKKSADAEARFEAYCCS